MRALVGDPALAVGPGEPRRAAAGVGSLTRVPAGGAVPAGPVVGAVVEVLVAEEAAPALVAVALVGPAASPVDAARVADALVAVGPGPAGLAPLKERKKRTFRIRSKDKENQCYKAPKKTPSNLSERQFPAYPPRRRTLSISLVVLTKPVSPDHRHHHLLFKTGLFSTSVYSAPHHKPHIVLPHSLSPSTGACDLLQGPKPMVGISAAEATPPPKTL